MKIYIKIGTLPASYMHVCNKRKEPKIGDWIQVKENKSRYTPKQGVLIDLIKNINGQELFFAKRM